ncbi:hypothetical protein A3Q56_03546 [Intoshia linei]|uniref:Uncharacterized protein n=1 Tax=Intoshia linei TaxID=1819745 RepID=A0A177B365_9BILA|nr:hypothetical protein A3Q56_03546 [Intoshia linei]
MCLSVNFEKCLKTEIMDLEIVHRRIVFNEDEMRIFNDGMMDHEDLINRMIVNNIHIPDIDENYAGNDPNQLVEIISSNSFDSEIEQSLPFRMYEELNDPFIIADQNIPVLDNTDEKPNSECTTSHNVQYDHLSKSNSENTTMRHQSDKDTHNLGHENKSNLANKNLKPGRRTTHQTHECHQDHFDTKTIHQYHENEHVAGCSSDMKLRHEYTKNKNVSWSDYRKMYPIRRNRRKSLVEGNHEKINSVHKLDQNWNDSSYYKNVSSERQNYQCSNLIERSQKKINPGHYYNKDDKLSWNDYRKNHPVHRNTKNNHTPETQVETNKKIKENNKTGKVPWSHYENVRPQTHNKYINEFESQKKIYKRDYYNKDKNLSWTNYRKIHRNTKKNGLIESRREKMNPLHQFDRNWNVSNGSKNILPGQKLESKEKINQRQYYNKDSNLSWTDYRKIHPIHRNTKNDNLVDDSRRKMTPLLQFDLNSNLSWNFYENDKSHQKSKCSHKFESEQEEMSHIHQCNHNNKISREQDNQDDITSPNCRNKCASLTNKEQSIPWTEDNDIPGNDQEIYPEPQFNENNKSSENDD